MSENGKYLSPRESFEDESSKRHILSGASPRTSPRPSPGRSLQKYDIAGSMRRLRVNMAGTTPPFTPPFEEDDSAVPKSGGWGSAALGQVPAIALVAMFHLMIGIPFGVSYFPMSWSSHETEEGDGGPFPLPGKEALGIRMFIFSTVVGQLVFTFASKFPNPIGLQMVENVPFTQALSSIVIAHQGYGIDALSTLIVMFGLASVVVGLVFWLLGKYHLGSIVYFFPTHVLIGCIGGIGLFIVKTGVEVTIAETFSFAAIHGKFNLLFVVLLFELVLRVLEQATKDEQGKPKYALLAPIFFCMITPIFYCGIALFGVSLDEAGDAGYFFPSLDGGEGDGRTHMLDMWTTISIPSVSLTAIWDAIPTLVALTLFSLIHVPINIPAFALSTKTDADMNNELMAHGYSNIIVGLFGGLQNYMAYTQSVLYDRSGGTGRPSGMAVAATTTLLFFVGPTVASYIPRCMAGTLLVHVGADLFLEGVWDTYGKFDPLEYAGIWLIVVVMTLYGMEAAMIAGVIAAVSTYAVQSVAYLSPIRGHMRATTLRSSFRNRNFQAQCILNSPTVGRSQILVVQLHGHLFFGNMAHFTEQITELVQGSRHERDGSHPVVLMFDFSLVLGIDSSAAQAITKLKDKLLREVEVCVFVTGSSAGFPTEFNLTDGLSSSTKAPQDKLEQINEDTPLIPAIAEAEKGMYIGSEKRLGSYVFESADEALVFAEDVLIAKQDPALLTSHEDRLDFSAVSLSKEEETSVAIQYLRDVCPVEMVEDDAETLFALFEREFYQEGDMIWAQSSESDCVKLLVSGMLIAELEDEAGTTETVSVGNTIGEVGLVNGTPRMSSVRCLSEEAVAYSLSRESFEHLLESHPRAARCIDLICVNYLQCRVQHVSNRVFETRCLPI